MGLECRADQADLTDLDRTPINNRVVKMCVPPQGRVLIVEDEEELAEVLEYNLIRNGFEVLIARDGLEACRMIGKENPDLILLDLLLPLLDGWEICRMLRSHQDPLVARTPIIMLSALGAVDDRLKGYDVGADLYLPKPYALKEVILKSKQLIAARSEYRDLAAKTSAQEKWNLLQDNWQHLLFHELKNQLTVISGMAQMLNAKDGLQRENSQQYARLIHNSSDYLGALAMNYMLVRQVETDPGKLQREPLLIQTIFQELALLFSPQAEQKSCGLQFDCSELLPVELHPVGLKIILSSLIDNALKYSKNEGLVTVSAQQINNELQLQVTDDGPGIAAEERGKVFEKFYRSEKKASAVPGSGLGLYMARTLAVGMGGALVLADRDETGCAFVLSFAQP